MPTPFASILPLERFREIVSAIGDKRKESYEAALRGIAEPALRAVLQERLREGSLRPVPNSAGHDSTFLRAWDGFVTGVQPDGDPVACIDRVVRFLTHSVVAKWAFFVDPAEDAKGDTAQAIKFHDILVAHMDSGNISHFAVPSETCWITDETYRIQFEGWNPTYVQWEPGGKLTPMQAAATASVKSFEVTFPTGELLVADWFRLDGFKEAIERDWEGSPRPSLNSVHGQEEATRRYAEAGMASVGVGNSDPKVFERDGVLVLGRGEGAELAQVCTDRWSVSIIDRARLVELLSDGADTDEAERAVAAYVAEGNASVIQVEPGTYTLYMTGDKEHFPELFNPEDVDLDEIQPFFALSPRHLAYDAGPSAGPQP